MAINKRVYILPKDTEPTAAVISGLLDSTKRKKEIKQYDLLEKYYNGEAVRSDLENDEPLRSVTDFPRYITSLFVGYLFGNKITYATSDGIDITPLENAYDDQIISDLDIRLGYDASKFSHGFELVYVNNDAECRSAIIDPRNVILVRDNTVEHNKMFAVIYQPSVDDRGEEIDGEYDVTILTNNKIMERKLRGNSLAGDESTDLPHLFGEVPVIEYPNDDDLIGDYEPVLRLIDGYNTLQTARINDRLKNANSILLVSGGQLNQKQIDNIMYGRLADLPEGAEMKYITKSTNEQESDTLRNSIANDIFSMAMAPDMSDQNFSGDASGVSLKYKLFMFEKHAKNKERCFEAGLKERFRLYNTYLNRTANMQIVPVREVDAVFTRALPQNDVEIAGMINNLDGIVDKETLVSQLSFVNDPKEVVELAEKEKEEAVDKFIGGNNDNFGTDNPSERDESEPKDNLEDM